MFTAAQLEEWFARLIAAIQTTASDDARQTLLRHIKGIRTHAIGFLDELAKLLTPPDGE